MAFARHKFYNHPKPNSYIFFVLFLLGLGSVGYGYNASIIGTTLGQPSFIKYMHLDTRTDGTDLASTTNGLFQAGGVIGTLTLPMIADKFGRRWGCAIPCIVLVISGAIMTASTNIGMFIAFRFFAGASSYMLLAAVPILMTEIVPAAFRGALVDIHAIMLVLGHAIQGWIGFAFYFWDGESNTWRPPMAISLIWPLALLVGLPFLPESPRWLCMQDRITEAEQILRKLHSDPRDPNHSLATAEFHQIRKQMEIDRTLGNSWVHIWRKPSYRKRAFLAIGTCGIIQCSGVLVINNYGPIIYKQLGFSPIKQLLYPAAWLTFAVGMNCIAPLLVDRFPRPRYMAFGVLACMATLILEAALVANFVGSDNRPAMQACVAMFFVFSFFYSLTMGGTEFAYLGEVFPTHIRAKGICLGVATISFMNLIWLQSAPVAFETIGWKFYLIMIIPGSIGGVIMWFYFPDTKGLPLEQIAAVFGDADEIAVYEREMAGDLISQIADPDACVGLADDKSKEETLL